MSDLTDAASPSLEKRELLAKEIRHACLNAGFFYAVKNHPVPSAIINRTFSMSESFFHLPVEAKETVDVSHSSNFRGYMGLLTENNDPANKGEMHEAFNIGLDPTLAPDVFKHQEDKRVQGETEDLEHSENLWPSQSDWRDAANFQSSALLKLGQSLFPLFALALDLPENFFDDKIQHPAAIMRLLHYPAMGNAEVDERTPGIGAHTDFECFTILCQGDVPGLQVQNRKGVWIDAVCIPGTFIINIGDQFARWTNDIFVSTRHRALPAKTHPRYSIPFFFGCDHDVPLIPPPTCVTVDRPWRYQPITAGKYVKMRLSEVYNVKKDQTIS
ncbi:hypothetical protein TREMEDRAFT_24489 [Tremella mesenterica DSM 1558]|uniref:uncharacterized protein n=1 Tax=Tremella mesenterica (strain ATCC 24925 / CBS 8224 / DSM 1558 / NBRC 9311 / NRRL Y-6157 / RJB 2259-6 / UBC 559-6) TaxID=578456 RepID=UPI0003F490E1|nr:uncharacterized protein TREMEDRAFT_24489 [Tremella mesenterica DSM 1558]EIW72526.1 hypothetical protein TREMEDRAFT_24489 [Tremella mesenterica DSM 1558]